MAADTANKRYSAMHMGCPWRSALPLPDGTTDNADRAALLLLYAGFVAGAIANVYGPMFCSMASVFIPGAPQGDIAIPGSQAATVFIPGAGQQ